MGWVEDAGGVVTCDTDGLDELDTAEPDRALAFSVALSAGWRCWEDVTDAGDWAWHCATHSAAHQAAGLVW